MDGATLPAAGSIYTIGANLDGQVPACQLGDRVIVGADTDLTGVGVYGFVKAANQVRINVFNVSSSTFDIPATTWHVTIL